MEPQQPMQPQGVMEPVGFPGAPATPNTAKKNWKWLIILVLFLIVIGGVTFFVFKSSKSGSDVEVSPTPEESTLGSSVDNSISTPTPSPTPANKSDIKIKVLNGTGISGEAGLLSDQLKNLGYTSVTTGNASDQTNTSTEVIFASGVPQNVQDEITTKLKSLYTTVNSSSSSLSDADIQITTGLRKGQTSKPATTTAPAATTAATATPAATASPTSTPQ